MVIEGSSPNPVCIQEIPIGKAAKDIGMTRHGLRAILLRTGKGIRRDGRWFVQTETRDQLAAARRVLGLKGAAT